MVLRGLLIAAGGFVFIFSPGLPIGLLSRHSSPVKRDLIYWGMGLWLVTLLPSLFIQSLLRQILYGNEVPRQLSGQPVDYVLTLSSAVISALLVQGAMLLVLRRQRVEEDVLPRNGLALGFGLGFMAQLFTGLGLVGAGFRLMFGDTSTPTLANLAQAGYLGLLLGLLPLILFRLARFMVSAIQGVLVGRALGERWRFFWLAVLVDATFVWAILALQLAIGGERPGQLLLGVTDSLTSGLTILYYILAFFLAYRLLLAHKPVWGQASYKRKD